MGEERLVFLQHMPGDRIIGQKLIRIANAKRPAMRPADQIAPRDLLLPFDGFHIDAHKICFS